jgi:hypothetical protein
MQSGLAAVLLLCLAARWAMAGPPGAMGDAEAFNLIREAAAGSEKAAKRLRTGADQGNPWAQHSLCVMSNEASPQTDE